MPVDALTLAAWMVVLVSLTTGCVLIFGGSLIGRVRAARIESANQAGSEADAIRASKERAANYGDHFSDAA